MVVVVVVLITYVPYTTITSFVQLVGDRHTFGWATRGCETTHVELGCVGLVGVVAGDVLKLNCSTIVLTPAK
jgi:hypothetical protein